MASLKELMAAKKQQLAERSGNRVNTVSPPPGSSRWRIMPSWRGGKDPQFFHEFGQHFIKDANGKTAAVYVCVENTYGKPCAVCDAVRDVINTATDDATKDLASKARSGLRIIVNAVQVDKDPKVPVILSLPQGLFQKIIDIYEQNADPDDDNYNILTDVESGVDIIITRTGTGLKTEYNVQPALKGSKPVTQDVLDKITNLDQYVAQEQEAGLLRATSAVRGLLGGVKAALPKSTDAEFDDDVPFHPSGAGTSDVIEGDYTKAEMADEDLASLLDSLE